LTDENNFVRDEASVILDSLLAFVKRSTGKISIEMKGKTAFSLNFEGDTLFFDIIDPTILGITEDNNDLGLIEKLRTAKKIGKTLNSEGLSISILRKGKRALTIGSDAAPTLSSLLTWSSDIQVDNIKQVAKLDRDLKKEN
jgi:hypothetical protein